jgi:hypothetical protein
MCYAISDRGMQVLNGAGGAVSLAARGEVRSGPASVGRSERASHLRQARHEVHVAAWALALVELAGPGRASLRATRDAGLQVPRNARGEDRDRLGPDQLRLPGGRVPHDFLRTDASGRRVEVESFEPLRPDVLVEIAGAGSVAGDPLGSGIDSDEVRQGELALDVIF